MVASNHDLLWRLPGSIGSEGNKLIKIRTVKEEECWTSFFRLKKIGGLPISTEEEVELNKKSFSPGPRILRISCVNMERNSCI